MSHEAAFVHQGLAAAAIGPAAADTPFAPIANTPDYIITMVDSSAHRKENGSRIVTHHGKWTRVETLNGPQRTTEYFPYGGATEIRVYQAGTNDIHLIHILRGSEQTSVWDRQPRNTGERQMVLGESCTVWNIKRLRDPSQAGPSLAKLSCMTDDGVELWYKFVGNNGVLLSAEATRIERRPVAPSEVEPPRALIALDWWNQPERTPVDASLTPDYETVMQSTGDGVAVGKLIRATRHHRAWRYVEEALGGVPRSLVVSNMAARRQLRFESDDLRAPRQLTTMTSPPALGVTPVPTWEPKDVDCRENVLGESCAWFDTMPGVADAGLIECRTHDGITLKEKTWTYGSVSRELVAVRFVRRTVSIEEVMPPAVILEPKTWGFE